MLSYTPIRDIYYIMDSQTGDCPQPSKECGDVDGESTFALALFLYINPCAWHGGYCSWLVCVSVCACLSRIFLIAVMIAKPRHSK